MSTTTNTHPDGGASGLLSWPARLRDWLDARGPVAWGTAVLVTTVVVWPLGLCLLAYAIWSHRMFTRTTTPGRTARARGWTSDWVRSPRGSKGPTGNRAFDARKSEALDRIEAERQAFEELRARQRQAEDKAEFDQFMADRRSRPGPEAPAAQG